MNSCVASLISQDPYVQDGVSIDLIQFDILNLYPEKDLQIIGLSL